MKKKIAIIGSTGSIGKSLISILRKNKKDFRIILLTGHKNYKKLFKIALEFKVQNLIITDLKSYQKLKLRIKNQKINIYNNFNDLDKILKNKIEYTMSSITGLDGLYPTLKMIKYTRKIAIANKESIICGWSLIQKELKKNNTTFLPVDSEHFSLWYGLKENDSNSIEKIYITASGGPFYKTPLKKFNKITPQKAINHPRWKMGKKISIDSATMINKVYEIIEAKNIFNIPYKKIDILVHPKSYIHSIIKFKNGLVKIIAHETTMKIPIFNTLYNDSEKSLKTPKINIKKLNNLEFNSIEKKRYPITRLLYYLNAKNSLFETAIVSANDTLVELFLKKKISFNEINKNLFKILLDKKILQFRKKKPSSFKQIFELNEYVRLKVLEKVYKSKNV